MSGVTQETVRDEEDGIRLDRWFRQRFPTMGHGQLQKMLRKGQVRVDGKRVKANNRVATGQQVRVPPMPQPDAAPQKPERQVFRLSAKDAAFMQGMVLHEDQHLIVLNKPSGLAVQGGSRTNRHIDGMLGAFLDKGRDRPRLVHRLDKDTSGVLLLARTAKAARFLAAAFKSKEARKLYWAALSGVPSPLSGRIDLALSKNTGHAAHGREQMIADDIAGKRAITFYETLEKAGRAVAWVALYPLTGRTHQLRAHTCAMETPIIGDGKYGGERAFPAIEGLSRQLHLHARALRIPHPGGGELEVVAPLPSHMLETWSSVGFLPGDHDGSIDWPDL